MRPRRRPSADASAERLGVFGGTFDPPHNGHLSVVEEVARRLRLDRVLWVPAGDPPHKPDFAASPPHVRLRMVRAAIEGHAPFEASALEVERPGPSFTVDTVRALVEAHPGAEIFVIVGMDQYETFGSWREPEQILALATLVVMDRSGTSAHAPVPPADGSRIVRVPVTRVDISSTEVRDRVRRGADIAGLVPPGVRAIIEAEGLYRGGGAG